MGPMASPITSLTLVYSTVYSGADQRNIKAPRHWPLCGEFTGDRWIPRTRASNAENVSIWWRHHDWRLIKTNICISERDIENLPYTHAKIKHSKRAIVVTEYIAAYQSQSWKKYNPACNSKMYLVHDDVIKWKHFPRYWPFVRGIHRSTVNSPHKGQWRGALMFSLICAWINCWVNNREAGDLRCHRAHYDVKVMPGS